MSQKEDKKPIVFSDVDGTLYARDCYVSNFNLNIIKQDNLSFNIATGNPICPRMLKLAKLVDADYMIGSSGVQIYDYKHNKYLHEEYLKASVVKKIFKLFKESKVSAAAWSSDVFYVFKEADKEFLNKIYYRYETFEQFELYEDQKDIKKVAKIEVYFENTPNVGDLIKELEKLDCQVIVTHMNLEIISKGASKGNAILWLLKHVLKGYNPEEVMVIGDSENDYSMFHKFNYSYVMDNAKDEVKDKANFITKAVQEHGLGYAVMDYLEKFNKRNN
ncbi:Cof-type HAD-IIB family hydrolase [Mycoplasmopsis fermentans]|nr:Cof-type HAD-IIB family hydrolase [Mycoplasmopsis fermentans]VEU66698.1 putative phosphotransferase [Mesomycoplasma conjunctivae]ADN68995.1 predicted COF family HAD hydrolase protein [Mycoplasmopsis fermentans JER]RMX35341.1 HAD hydrolase, IIB family protein [Mycoplasmopsis fermentans MF-I1]RMX35610.1 HAD hydrolase, IIB family protein [Mycoplasmopsis fermentans MF-I2]VEU64059.1 putative phosphotransferase [Mycoplasmopsis fermentans]